MWGRMCGGRVEGVVACWGRQLEINTRMLMSVV